MEKEIAINGKNITKTYKLYDNPADRVKEAFHPFRKKYFHPFDALNSITLKVNKGETLGIIGKNGCGKSTLLQIICGILQPSAGSVEVKGRVSALLELGAGFNPEFSGIENVYLNGSIMGYSKAEMDRKIDDILSFAEIGDFVYQPIRMYSSGMYVRLAFAAAISCDPDVLVVDEALSVGDIRFQQKCFRKIRDIKKTATILFVSHDIGAVNNLCDRVLWLDQGMIRLEGDPETVSKEYASFMTYGLTSDRAEKESALSEPKLEVGSYDIAKLSDGLTSFGNKGAEIIGVSLLDVNLEKIVHIKGGERAKLLVRFKANQSIPSPIVGFGVKDRLGNHIFGSNTFVLKTQFDTIAPNEEGIVAFSFTWPNLVMGCYTITVGLAEGTQLEHTQHHWVHDALIVQCHEDPELSNVGGLLVVKEIESEVTNLS